MTRRLALLLGAAAVLVATLAIAWWPRPPGPLLGGLDATRTGFPADPNTPFTYGYLALRNTARAPAVLGSVTLIDPDPGLEIVGIRTLRAREASRGGVATAREFPPAFLDGEPLHELRGFAVMPHRDGANEDVWVLLGLTVPSAGVYNFQGIEVMYTVGGATYMGRYPHALRVCSPAAAFETCIVDDVPALD